MNSKLLYIPFIAIVAISCNSSDLEQKKKDLEELKASVQETKDEINALEKEIAEMDPEYDKKKESSILVNALTTNRDVFEHKILVQGEVASKRNINMSAEMMGRVTQITVDAGDKVRKGQTLIKMDNETILSQIREVQTGLELAQTVFEKQKNLWEQNIGTEIQYLEAKNKKESLEKQLSTLRSQLQKTVIKAPFSGRINNVDARVGELLQPGRPVLSMVSLSEMYLKADVSENYINSFEEGDQAEVYLPSIDEKYVSGIRSVSYVINPANRTFEIEIPLNEYKKELKPNQFARIELTDYRNETALTVPTKVIQQDNLGDFVFGLEKQNGSFKAKKVRVTKGKSFNGKTEIVDGLKEGTQIVTDGYRDVVDGMIVKLANQ